jgi:NAD+ kinase
MRGPWAPASETTLIGIVTDPGEQTADTPAATRPTTTVLDALEQFDESTVRGDPQTVLQAEPTLCLTIGEAGFRKLAAQQPDSPILPVDADDGVHSITPEAVGKAVETVLAGRALQCPHQLLSVTVDDGRVGTVVRDLSLITAEPAQITELAVRHEPARSGGQTPSEESRIDREIVQVRADGLVVATPAGSHGYAAAADGPLLRPGTGLAIVPIAPFVTDRHNWVTTIEALVLSIERDEGPVALRIDGTEHARIEQEQTVRAEPAGTISTLVTEASALQSTDR